MTFYILPLTFTIDTATLGYHHIKNFLGKSKPDRSYATTPDEVYDDVVSDEGGNVNGEFFYKSAIPEVSVVVSSHKQSDQIEQTVKNIYDQSYPLNSVIISDSNLDDTKELVASLGEKFPSLNLKYWSKDGVTSKAGKINNLVKDPEVDLGDYVYFIDTGIDMNPDTITLLADAFSEDDIAAVTSYGVVTPNGNYRSNMYHHGKEWTNRMGKYRKLAQKHRNAIPVLCGASFMAKTEVLKDTEFPTNTQTEDTAFTWLLQRNGHKVGYEPDAFVSADDVSTLKKQIEQTWRWYMGTWQNLYTQKEIFGPKSKAKSLAYTTLAPSLVESLLYAGTVVSLPFLAYYEPNLAQHFLIGDTVLSLMTPAVAPILCGEPKAVPGEIYRTVRHYHQITAYKIMSSALWLASGAKVGFDVVTRKNDKWTNDW